MNLTKMISIVDLKPADVLCAFYNYAAPMNLGFLQYQEGCLSKEEADKHLRSSKRIDSILGRQINIKFKSNEVDVRIFNEMYGNEAAEEVIDSLKESGKPNSDKILQWHEWNLEDAAKEARLKMKQDHQIAKGEGIFVTNMGLSDMAHLLEPAIAKALHKDINVEELLEDINNALSELNQGNQLDEDEDEDKIIEDLLNFFEDLNMESSKKKNEKMVDDDWLCHNCYQGEFGEDGICTECGFWDQFFDKNY